MRRALPDAPARRRAVTDFDTNLVVEAGAGAGKTSLLVERVLVAIGAGVTSIDELAAITFTERAAGEMRERIAAGLDRLMERCDGAAADDAHEADRAFALLSDELGAEADDVRGRALRALEDLDRASISTIHAFCNGLLREFPFDAGVDPDFTVDDGQLWATTVRESWEAFLATELGPHAERGEIWNRLLERATVADIGAVADRLAGAVVHRGELPDGHAVDGAERERIAGDVLSELRALRDDPEAASLIPSQTTRLAQATLAFELFIAEGTRDAMEELVRRDAPSTKSKKLSDAFRDRYKNTFARAWRLARTIARIDDEAVGLLVDAVAPFVATCRETMLRRGVVTFDALLGLARALVRDRPAVRRRLKRRYRLLLVDEFQDTDPLQYDIVLFLAEADDEEAQHAYEARLAPGRLFVVGDPKQSIYRFRGADYAAYRRAVERIVATGGARLSLTANFRSVPEVLQPVNAVFARDAGTWVEGEAQPPYAAIAPARGPADAEAPRVEILSVRETTGPRATERRLDEGRALAAEILRLRSDGIRFGAMTVLLRAFSSVDLFLRGLRGAGVPFAVDGGKDFVRRPEVGQIVAALRTIAQPADEPALLAYLRSPAGAVPDPELAAWAADGGRWAPDAEPAAERFPRLADALARLRALAVEVRELPADAAVRRVLAGTRLVPLGAAAAEGAQRVANLRKLAAAAADLARDGGLTLEQVTEALEEGRLADVETDSPLADDRADAVRVTSIHRMKGLESDVILLGDLFRGEGRGPAAAVDARLVAAGGPTRLALKTPGFCSSTWLTHEAEEERHAAAEEIRVLYVALTRARERLVLMSRDAPDRGDSPWVRAFAAWGYDPHAGLPDGPLGDGRVGHRTVEPARRHARGAAAEPPDPSARRRWDGVVATLVGTTGPRFARPSAGAPGHDRTAPPRGAGAGAALGRAVGIAVHRALEGFDPDDSVFRRRLLDVCRAAADETGVDHDVVRRESEELLRVALASPLGRRLREADVIGREVPMLLRADDGTRYRGTIDLLYRDPDGRVVVADYKTDADPDAAALAVRYAPQLRIYAHAVHAALALPSPPAAELWLLRHPAIHRL